jgi:hypothetical protein
LLDARLRLGLNRENGKDKEPVRQLLDIQPAPQKKNLGFAVNSTVSGACPFRADDPGLKTRTVAMLPE